MNSANGNPSIYFEAAAMSLSAFQSLVTSCVCEGEHGVAAATDFTTNEPPTLKMMKSIVMHGIEKGGVMKKLGPTPGLGDIIIRTTNPLIRTDSCWRGETAASESRSAF